MLDDGQALAPAESATFEYCAAGGSKHALEEAVLSLARDAFRLVGTLRHEGVLTGQLPGARRLASGELPRSISEEGAAPGLNRPLEQTFYLSEAARAFGLHQAGCVQVARRYPAQAQGAEGADAHADLG